VEWDEEGYTWIVSHCRGCQLQLLAWFAERDGDGCGVVVKLLLAKDSVNLDTKDKYGRIPLWWAIEKGHETVVELLLDLDPRELSGGITCSRPRISAARRPHTQKY
jgi:ankyrin repeat protein